jgi:hypothetical protein
MVQREIQHRIGTACHHMAQNQSGISRHLTFFAPERQLSLLPMPLLHAPKLWFFTAQPNPTFQ